MHASERTSNLPPVVTSDDVEREIIRLFAGGPTSGLVVRVQGGEEDAARREAFSELLASLAMYDARYRERRDILIDAPSSESITAALSVLGEERLRRRLFEHILSTFGRKLVDPLGALLDTTPGGALTQRMTQLRDELCARVGELGLTQETREMLLSDVRKLLSEEYLAMLSEHEQSVQRPRVKLLAQEVLRLIGSVFQRAFARWPAHARQIAESASRRMGGRVRLRESPLVIRERIVEGIEEFLWVETSMELSGALSALFAQPRYAGLLEGVGGPSNNLDVGPAPELERRLYREFAEACWLLIEENC